MMQFDDLTRYNIPARMTEMWKERLGETLLPVQSHAVQSGLLDDSRADRDHPNMIISAPTSSGKSFCGEMAAVKALTGRRKGVMLFPLKSLAEENYRTLQQTYGDLGLRCLIATGDHPENDAAFAKGDFNLAVSVHEKFDLLLTEHLDFLRNIGLVVVDEIQMISEPGRGAVLERMLTKILGSAYTPTIVALSAVLSDRGIAPLAEWLRARVVEETTRPRDLLRGVAVGGEAVLRSFNDGCDRHETFAGFEPSDETLADALLRQIGGSDGQTLIFLKSRADSVNLALKLAAAVGWGPAKFALEALDGEEPSALVQSLSQVLRHGVAFHNSDLSLQQRKIIEYAFVNKEIKALCSTTTLALGVNVFADTVYLETVKYTNGVYDNRPGLVPISRSEFDNMAGRAGRLGGTNDQPGRAIILADSSFDRDILWDNYIGMAPCRPVESALGSMPLVDWTLHMVACGLGHGRDDLRELYGRTLHARLSPDEEVSFRDSLAYLQTNNLIRCDETERSTATAAGKSVANTGLTVREGVHFLHLLETVNPQTLFGWTCVALSSPDWVLPPAILTWYEQADNLPVKMLYQRLDHSVEEAVCLLPESRRREPLSFREAAALKSALLLDEWCRLVPLRKIEERYQIHLGQLQSLGLTAAHLIAALGRLIKATDRESPLPSLLAPHAFSLRYGLPPSLEPMYRRVGHVLSRSALGAVYAAGIETVEELGGLSAAELEKLVKDKSKALSVMKLLNTDKEEVQMQSTSLQTGLQPVAAQPGLIEIDGSFDADRFLVRIDGFPVRLTGKSFKYLTKLAWSRLRGNDGWIFKEDIEVGFNQARYLYRMKNEISAGFSTSWPVVENNRMGYYRLDIAPEKIRVNTDKLREHPDYELRSLVTEPAAPDVTN